MYILLCAGLINIIFIMCGILFQNIRIEFYNSTKVMFIGKIEFDLVI